MNNTGNMTGMLGSTLTCVLKFLTNLPSIVKEDFGYLIMTSCCKCFVTLNDPSLGASPPRALGSSKCHLDQVGYICPGLRPLLSCLAELENS